MRNVLLIIAVLALVSLMVLGCTKSDYPTGYATAGGQQNPNQGYVGGGCGVAGTDAGDTGLQIPDSSSAA